MVSLLAFAAEVKRRGYTNQLMQLTRFPEYQKSTLAGDRAGAKFTREEVGYYQLAAQQLCGRVMPIP